MNVSYQFKPNQYTYPTSQSEIQPKQKNLSKNNFKQTFFWFFNNLMVNK